MFEWARRRKLVAHNPFSDVHITVPRKVRNREGKAFYEEEIRAILSASLTIGQPKTKAQAVRRWVPWLLAYTGARVGEITQLRNTDVFERGGIAAIKITPEAGPIKTKQARTVPLHEHLIEQGFLTFVKASGKGPLFYEPTDPAQKEDPTKPRRPGAVKAGERLAVWVRKLGVTDKDIAPNHGWRHSFKQIARRQPHRMDVTMINWIVGHTQGSEGDKYGEPTLKDKAEALRTFPRYELTTGEAAK